MKPWFASILELAGGDDPTDLYPQVDPDAVEALVEHGKELLREETAAHPESSWVWWAVDRVTVLWRLDTHVHDQDCGRA
jgi:hypothetical protein